LLMHDIWILLLGAFVISAMSGFAIIPAIADFCIKHHLYDIPNQRKVHHDAIPRLGGACFLPCALLSFGVGMWALWQMGVSERYFVSLWSVIFFISLAIIYTVGIIDDVIGVGATVKFVAQIVAASLLPASGLYINDLYGMFGVHEIPFYIGAPLTVFLIVLIDNAINLIDGIDGLAAGLALLSLFVFMVVFLREGVFAYAILIAGLMGVIAAYMYFNLFGSIEKGHKIFMGDSGSLTIGFILGFLLVKFSMNNPSVMPYRSDSLLTTYTLLIVPCFDVMRVIMVRLHQGQPLFQADKSHIHHRLMRCGLSQHQTLATILALALFFVLLNNMLHTFLRSTEIVIIDIAAFVLFQLVVDYFIYRRKQLEKA